MTVRDVAKRLEISVSLVYRLIETGKLRCSRHGLGRGVIRVSEGQIADYLSTVEQNPRRSQPESAPARPRLKHLRL